MKFKDMKGVEITEERFLQLRDYDISVFGNAFFETTENEYKLLDPAKIHVVFK